MGYPNYGRQPCSCGHQLLLKRLTLRIRCHPSREKRDSQTRGKSCSTKKSANQGPFGPLEAKKLDPHLPYTHARLTVSTPPGLPTGRLWRQWKWLSGVEQLSALTASLSTIVFNSEISPASWQRAILPHRPASVPLNVRHPSWCWPASHRTFLSPSPLFRLHCWLIRPGPWLIHPSGGLITH